MTPEGMAEIREEVFRDAFINSPAATELMIAEIMKRRGVDATPHPSQQNRD